MTTIAVLNEQDLKNGEMKEVEFNDGKVLVSRIGDKIHATSAFCTHYGAPLAKGVLTSDGRVVCPWHGACFNVCSGDIEDSPGLDAIHSFKAEIRGGQILVTADPAATRKENKARPPTTKGEASSAFTGPGVLIVGGGAGALNVIESARESGYLGPITVISTEPYVPIDRTRLSKGLVGDAAKLQWRTPQALREQFGAEVKTGVTVTSCDFNAKSVTTSSGETYQYGSLVLATGGKPRRLPIDGANLSNVYTLRHVEDAKKIDAACQEGKRLVVIGSSFISMELVVAVSKRKLASIDVIGMEEVPFELVLGKQVGKGLQTYQESQGVRFHMQTKVSRIIASSSDPNVASGVKVSEKILEADVVIMGVGVAPATDFLKGSAISLEKDGGLSVDEFMRVKNLEDVYAVGDIAHYPVKALGQTARIEHWNVASNQGRAVGQTLAGKKHPFEKVPIFWSAQGGQLRYCGYGAGHDDVILQGNPAELKFVAYYCKAGRVIAVASMAHDPLVSKCSELMRLGLMPSAQEIKSGKNPLEISLAK